ncbi:hypothetical protein QZH41_017787 [Actinostola sp. cb2023]|nr:hypothetical protein QZH41_017787 [Actinostola sp. cb2023]
MAESDEVQEDEIDYYGVLNVRKQATEEELRSSYRRMCVLYHPDKHQDPTKKAAAVQLFSKVQKAYDVLSNPETKSIYDIYGQKGLDAGWEIVERKRTQAEGGLPVFQNHRDPKAKDFFASKIDRNVNLPFRFKQNMNSFKEKRRKEGYNREQTQRVFEINVSSCSLQGSISVGIDATDLFDHFDIFEDRTFPNIEINNMSIMQAIEAPLTKKDTATLAGSLAIKNGNGSGDISMSIRRVLSYKAWGEIEIGAGNGPSLALRGFRNISKRSYATSGLNLQLRGNMLAAGIEAMVARQLGKHTNGYLTWKAGIHSCMNSTIVRETEHSRAILVLQLGIPNTFAVASYTRKLEDTRLKVAVKIGAFGTIFEYGAERKISQHSHLGATISVGLPVGVTLKIKLVRSTQVYSFPMSLSEEISPAAMFYGTVVPLVLYWAVKVLVVNPFLKHEKEKETEQNKEKNEREMAEKKREAETCVDLMKTTYERIVEFERSRHVTIPLSVRIFNPPLCPFTIDLGLIVISAWYGNLVSMDTTDLSDVTAHMLGVIDVTFPVQCQVKDSRLFLSDVHKYNLSGFYDPCPGQDKLLRIRYEFRDAIHEVTVGDLDQVKLPKQCELCEDFFAAIFYID